MKTVGIIGGLGPETTAVFYEKLILKCYKVNSKQRPPILMWSIPMKYQIEEDLISRAQGEERYIPYLVEAAKRLEAGGADFIVIPCNSVHIFIDEVRTAVSIPVLSIVESTATFLKDKVVKEVGLLATLSTIEKGLYQNPLSMTGIKTFFPTDEDQKSIGSVINRLVRAEESSEDRATLISIIDSFVERGLKTVILACTDLQLLTPVHNECKVYDSMDILLDATVKNIFSD